MAAPSTKELWREFCAYTPTPDALRPDLSCAEISALSAAQRKAYNKRRIGYIYEERILQTANLKAIEATVKRFLFAAEVPKYSARRGLQISGPARVGKTTAVLHAVRKLEADMRRRYDRTGDQQYLPIVYTSLTAATTPNKFWAIIANFVGIPPIRGPHSDSVMFRLTDLLRDMGTRFVIVDEVQRLNTDHVAGVQVADTIKSFAEYLDATMIYAGTTLETAPLFTGEAGAQWRARTVRIDMRPYTLGTDAQRLEWAQLVGGFEQYLPLPRHHTGYLVDHAEYLFHRSGGSIATLRDLIADAAYQAIESGEERITTDLLDDVAVDEEARRLATLNPSDGS